MAIHHLIGRLREFETEALRLSTQDLPRELQATKEVYLARLDRLESSHSQSWFGEHANTYYENFSPPPGGASFDVEWGFIPPYSGRRNSGWRTYSRDELRRYVFDEIGEEIFHVFHNLAASFEAKFSLVREQALDVLEPLSRQINSERLNRYIQKIETELKSYTPEEYINGRIKTIPRMTRDSVELAKGQVVPIHIQYMSSVKSFEVTKQRTYEFATTLRSIIELSMLIEPRPATSPQPRRIFIGHGRSAQWLVVKDFIRDRLHLEYDEFNRIPPAGLNTQERLTEMLNECGFALLVFTAEDEHGDGSLHARENVVHEAGLFQGRLGWRKAIILLEEGCQEFSNIVGLGQIRFPKGNIAGCFEEIRRVLEREGILQV